MSRGNDPRRSGKKGKRRDLRPCRQRYWKEGRLKQKKVTNLLKQNGFNTRAEALSFWLDVRKKRIKALH